MYSKYIKKPLFLNIANKDKYYFFIYTINNYAYNIKKSKDVD